MFYAILYFVFCYGIIWRVLHAIGAASEQRKSQPKLLAALKVLLLCVPLLPYAVVAAQTAIYKKPMLNEVRKAMASMGEKGNDIVTFRVLRLTPLRAEVYIVQPCGEFGEAKDSRSATIFYFKSTAKGWVFDEYDSPWSECGSAQGNTFPPYLDANKS